MRDTSFAEILEKMTDEMMDESSVNQEIQGTVEPAFLSSLIGSVPFVRVLNHSTSQSFSAYTRPGFSEARESLKLKSHLMTAAQFKAYEMMLYALELPILKAHALFPESFNLLQLKKAYKLAALKNHPDTGGCHESFLEIKKCYEILEGFAKTKAI